MTNERNPTILPQVERRTPACPKCGHPDFVGRNIGGVIHFTCKKEDCRNKWMGGLPQTPEDPTRPRPPESPTTSSVQYARNSNPHIPGDVIETVPHQNPTPAFRRGALVPEEEE